MHKSLNKVNPVFCQPEVDNGNIRSPVLVTGLRQENGCHGNCVIKEDFVEDRSEQFNTGDARVRLVGYTRGMQDTAEWKSHFPHWPSTNSQRVKEELDGSGKIWQVQFSLLFCLFYLIKCQGFLIIKVPVNDKTSYSTDKGLKQTFKSVLFLSSCMEMLLS